MLPADDPLLQHGTLGSEFFQTPIVQGKETGTGTGTVTAINVRSDRGQISPGMWSNSSNTPPALAGLRAVILHRPFKWIDAVAQKADAFEST